MIKKKEYNKFKNEYQEKTKNKGNMVEVAAEKFQQKKNKTKMT